MNKEEFERLERRFGSRPSTWPAPYRKEAAIFLGIDQDDSADSTLDRLILDLTEAPADQADFQRAVLRRIGEKQRLPLVARMQKGLSAFPTAASVAAMILVGAGLTGYSVAGRSVEMSNDLLLAFAVGEADLGLVQAFGFLPADGDKP